MSNIETTTVAEPHQQVSSTGLVIRNTFFMGAGQFASQAVQFVTGIMLANYLGVDTYSDYSKALMFIGIFAIVPTATFNNVFLRICSEDKTKIEQYLGSTLVLNVIATFLFLGIAIFWATLHYDSTALVLVLILGTSTMFRTLDYLYLKLFQAHQRLHVTTFTSMGVSLLYCAGLWVAMFLHWSVIGIAIWHLVNGLILLGVDALMVTRVARIRVHREAWGPLLRQGLNFGLLAVFTSFAYRMDGFLLSVTCDGDQAGYFAAAYRLIEALAVSVTVVNWALLPAMYSMSGDPQRLAASAKRVVRYFVVAAIPVAVILWGRREEIIDLLFKPEFDPAADVLAITAGVLAFRFVTVVCDGILYAFKREKLLLLMYGVQACLVTTVGLLLIPRYGAIGAATSALIAQGVYSISVLIMTDKQLKTSLWKLFPLPLLAGAGMGVILWLTPGLPYLGVVLAIAFFIGVMAACRYYRWTDLMLMLQLTLNRKPKPKTAA